MSAPIRRSPVHTGTVVATEQLTPRMRRVTVRADTMVGVELRPAPGQLYTGVYENYRGMFEVCLTP